MVRQVPSSDIAEEKLKNKNSYFSWLCIKSGCEGPLARLFFETDFRWDPSIKDDENRAKEAKDLREQYAIFMLADESAASAINKEQWHNIDILKKSIIGPACVFEVLVCLAKNLDGMLNMEPTSKVQKYFSRIMSNVGFDFYDEEDWDDNPDRVEKYWKKLLDRVLDRNYLPDGEGGLFPLDIEKRPDYDATKRSLWEQMNDWADQETDENDDFLV